jgi:hypothetical protein
MHLIFMVWRVLPTLTHVPFVPNVMERIIFSNYSYNRICDEHTIDCCLPFDTIDKFLVNRMTVQRLLGGCDAGAEAPGRTR